jgi:NADH dehydrogenase
MAVRHRVVVIGSGFGGLFATRRLRRAPVDVTLIDRANHHLFQPLLYQVATGILSDGEIAPPSREILRRAPNVRVELANVTHIDLDARTVIGDQLGRKLVASYDSLIVATGSSHSYFGHDEFERWAPAMKTLDNARELRARLFGAFEVAEFETDVAARRSWMTFAVIGGGPTGVEVAGQIEELSRRSLRRNFRSIDPASARVVLCEAGPAILPTFGKRLSEMATRELERKGIDVLVNSAVVGVDASGVDLRSSDGKTTRIECMTKVWAAGVEASPLAGLLAEASGAEVDRHGRVHVLPDCTLEGHPEVFVIGDAMALGDLPGVAEVAIQQGLFAARTIRRRLRGRAESKPFRYIDLGSLAVVSRFRAVASIGPIRVGGFIGWLAWLVVHLTFLTGFKNRVAAVAHWAVSFVGRSRSERALTVDEIRPESKLADPGSH